jgi:hypothetical protein
MIRLCAARSRAVSMLALCLTLACLPTATLAATQLTGAVRNQTRNQPAVGDDVILMQLDAGTPQELRTRTDAQGSFTLSVQNPDQLYLVRVVHQGVAYDQKASPGEALSIRVFDAAPRVPGVTGTIEILRTGTNGNLLHVSDMYEIRNASTPPLTLAGDRTFDVYLPADAKIDSVLAAGPGEIALMISAAPVPGDPGHFTVNFPLRPGATKFAFNYDVPYAGHAAFRTRHAYPLQQFAVMIPPTMRFSSHSPAFKVLATGNTRYQVRATNQLPVGEGPAFEIAGTGALPPIAEPSKPAGKLPQRPARTAPAAPARNPAPSLASVAPRIAQLQTSSQSIALATLLTIVLVAASCWLVLLSRKERGGLRTKTAPALGSHAQPASNLLSSLQKELSQLEADRRRGSISESEYVLTKRAIETVLGPLVNR